MARCKVFVNNTSENLEIILLLRQGDDPTHSAGTQTFTLDKGQRKDVVYGKDANSACLNGIILAWKADGARFFQEQRVAAAHSRLDTLLNTHSTIVIDSLSPTGVIGTN